MPDTVVIYLNTFSEQNTYPNLSIHSPAANTKIKQFASAFAKNNLRIVSISSYLFYAHAPGNRFHILREPTNRRHIVVYPVLKIRSQLLCLVKIVMLIRKLRKQHGRCVIFYYNYWVDTALPAFLARLLFNVPIVAECEELLRHDGGLSPIKKTISRILEKMGRYLNYGNVVVSSKVATELACNNTLVCRGFIDERLLQKAQAQPPMVSDAVCHLTYSGRLDVQRGVLAMLDELQSLEGNYHLHISGYGPEESVVRQNMQRIQESGKIRCTYHGFLSFDELEALFLRTTCFINPQLPDHLFSQDSFPSKVFQYLSVLRPVITTACADMDTLKIPGLILYQPGTLAQTIHATCKTPFLPSQMREAIDCFREAHFGRELTRLFGL